MKHPDPTEWMSFLYGEVSHDERATLDAHLAVCPDCVRRLARWRETLGLLDAAGVPDRPAVARDWLPAVRWAAAVVAVVGLVGTGFALGRQGTVSDAQLDVRLAELQGRLRENVAAQRDLDLRAVAEATAQRSRTETRELLGEFLRQYQAVRVDDRADMLGGLRALDERHRVETARLREGLVSLAASTGSGFEQTQNQMQWLTSYLPAVNALNEPLFDSGNPSSEKTNP